MPNWSAADETLPTCRILGLSSGLQGLRGFAVLGVRVVAPLHQGSPLAPIPRALPVASTPESNDGGL